MSERKRRGPPRVVVVDDNVDTRHLVRDELRAQGLLVVAEADDDSRALDAVRTLNPDAVVVSLGMRAERGAAVLIDLSIATSECACVACCWDPASLTLGGMRALGADLYVTTDEGPAELAAHVQSVAIRQPDHADATSDRLAAVRADLEALHKTTNPHLLPAAERRRYDRLRLIEERLAEHAGSCPRPNDRFPALASSDIFATPMTPAVG